MGTDIYLQGTPGARRNLPELRAAVWKQLRPHRLSPDASMMVLMAKPPSKLLPPASVCRPTAQVHAANDALVVQAYKHMVRISHHAHTEALWGPWEHGCQGLARSSPSWQTAVTRDEVRHGARAKEDFGESQTYTLQAHQALRGGCRAVLTPGQYTNQPSCPHLIATLQRVVDEMSMPMWMPSPCLGMTLILVRGPRGSRVGAAAAPAPKVEVCPTQYGDVVQVVILPTVYKMVRALGYHHLGHLYTKDHRVKGERSLKERAPARKGIPGLWGWLTRHGAVLAPLLRVPPPRWQTMPKALIPGAVPAYPPEVLIGGRVAETSGMETVYHGGYPIKVMTAMKDAMEANDWAPELLVSRQPPNTVLSDPSTVELSG